MYLVPTDSGSSGSSHGMTSTVLEKGEGKERVSFIKAEERGAEGTPIAILFDSSALFLYLFLSLPC